ncbi:hypothetical protein Tco_1246008 [Tanacetum coccineum]
MDSSMGKMCLGKDIIEISSDRNEGSGDWDSPECKDTTGSGGKKKPDALVFYKMDTEEESDRYIAQCFVNGLYAPDGEINLAKDDNLISNNYAVKLCLEYEVRNGKKLVKKELMVSLRGELYLVQFIINPEEDEFEPSLILVRSFLLSANAVANFGEGTITIQPDFDPFLLSSDEEGNLNPDDLGMLLDFDFDEVPQTKTDLPPMVCKMGKGSRNKKKVMENIMYFHNGAGPSSSSGRPLTQEKAEKRALAHNISMRYEMLEEVRPMLKEKKDLGAFIFPIRLECLINENALADTRSDINTMPYRIYEQLGRDDIVQENRNITMINYTEAEVTGRLVNVLCQVGFTTLTAKAARSEKIRIAESDSDDEEDYVIKRNEMGTPIHNSRPIGYQNNTNPAENMNLSTLESVINPFRKISVWKKAISFLGSLPAKLRDVKWRPEYKGCYSNPELATGQWKTEIHLTDPYGNVYMQAFVTKPTKRKLSKFHKLRYADSDWAGSIDDSKSTSGYIFTLGSGVFCWNSKKQSIVTQSSAEAEYISVAGAVNHAIWIRKLLSDLDLTQEGPTAIFCDNKFAIAIAENPLQHGGTKHINVKYHAIREAEKNREVKLKYCTSETQLANMLTKSITRKKLNYFKAQLMKSNKNLKEEY